MKLSYAFTAAATRGSAGAELLDVAGVVAALVFGEVGPPEALVVLGELTWLSGALGPGFGLLLLHPARAAAIAAATSTTQRDPRTCPPFSGVTPPFAWGDASGCRV